MLRHALRAALILSVAGAVCAASGLAMSKDFDQSYPLQPGGSFELQNVNGMVEVEGWDRDAIEVHAVKTAKSKESDLDRVSIEVDAKPRSVSVITRYPQNAGVEVAVEYVIHVPHSAHVEHVGTVNGTLKYCGCGCYRRSPYRQWKHRGVRRRRLRSCAHHQWQCASGARASRHHTRREG